MGKILIGIGAVVIVGSLGVFGYAHVAEPVWHWDILTPFTAAAGLSSTVTGTIIQLKFL